ncbi:MAG: FHA domain-containing protein [Prevotella sp.]|nr:FHA domain-containing protein [Prevotella sp.]
MIRVIFGRDGNTGQLHIQANGKAQSLGNRQSVPESVSREHISFTVDDAGVMVVGNLNMENDTYVNGLNVEQKQVKKGDVILLGKDRYRLEWDTLAPFIPNFADIRPLKSVWDSYQQSLLDLLIKERRFNVLRSATGLLTMGAMVIGGMGVASGSCNSVRMFLYVLAFLVSGAFFVKAFLDSAKMPKLQREIQDEFSKNYVCPHCRHFMGNQSYDILSQSKGCPYCGAVYKK